jgi:uncharacterized membrane protein
MTDFGNKNCKIYKHNFKNLKLNIMMNGMNHGWGIMGIGYGWIIGLIVLAVIIWLLVKAMNQKNNPNQPNK